MSSVGLESLGEYFSSFMLLFFKFFLFICLFAFIYLFLKQFTVVK